MLREKGENLLLLEQVEDRLEALRVALHELVQQPNVPAQPIDDPRRDELAQVDGVQQRGRCGLGADSHLPINIHLLMFPDVNRHTERKRV